MDHPETSRFWQTAIRSGLIDAAGLRECWEAIPPEKRVAEAIDRRLARRAVQGGRLTAWQAYQLLQGRYKDLKIGRYTLRELLGQGGAGRVFLADDTRLGRPVALKFLSRERYGTSRGLARFDREIRSAARLQHENLVRIYDDGEVDGLRFLVMEYIEGKSVTRIIQDHGRLPPAVAAEQARQVAVGLEYLLEQGLLHRDVNPSNILVDRRGIAKLTDLGLALDVGDPVALTREGSTLGTLEYLSPEQAWSSRSVDIRSDIYSLGCSLYHMIAGHVPFPTAAPLETLLAHQKIDPEPLTVVVPGCPAGLGAAVARMMRKSPADRFQRPDEVIRALGPFCEGPVPLSRIARATSAAPMPDRAEPAGPTLAEDSEMRRPPAPGGAELPPTSSADDVFSRVDLEPDVPPVSKVDLDPDDARRNGPAGRDGPPAAWLALAVLVLALLALLIGLSLGSW